jgi:hypothetical protein
VLIVPSLGEHKGNADAAVCADDISGIFLAPTSKTGQLKISTHACMRVTFPRINNRASVGKSGHGRTDQTFTNHIDLASSHRSALYSHRSPTSQRDRTFESSSVGDLRHTRAFQAVGRGPGDDARTLGFPKCLFTSALLVLLKMVCTPLLRGHNGLLPILSGIFALPKVDKMVMLFE